MASSNVERMGKSRYPLPLVHCSSPVKSIYDNNSITSEASSTRTATAFAAALRGADEGKGGGDGLWGPSDMPSDTHPSARSGISSVSSISSLSNSTQSYGFYNGNMHRLNAHTRSFAPPPSYDLKSFLGGRSAAQNGAGLPLSIETSDKSLANSEMGGKFRASSDGRSYIMPLTMQYQKTKDSTTTTSSSSSSSAEGATSFANHAMRSSLSRTNAKAGAAATALMELQIGLPTVSRMGTGSYHGNAQTSRSVNLQSARAEQKASALRNSTSLKSLVMYNDDCEDASTGSSASASRSSGAVGSKSAEGGLPTVVLSNNSLKGARNEFLSMGY